MRSAELQNLNDAVESRFGRTTPYGGDAEDGHGIGFTLEGARATFSVHTQEGTLPLAMFDVQIESNPPGDYIFNDVVTLEAFLSLVAKVHGPIGQWPRMP